MPLDLVTLRSQIRLPGMTFVEDQIAKLWLEAHADEWQDVAFNVRLGEGEDFGDDVDPETARVGRLNSQKRADFIVTSPSAAAIVEVKVRVASTAIGELLIYHHLWPRFDPAQRPAAMIAIGRSVVPDIRELLNRLSIRLELFPRVEIPTGFAR